MYLVLVFAHVVLTILFFHIVQLAAKGARCDYGIYLGAGPDNYDTIKNFGHLAAGLKMYLNETFTTLRLDDLTLWMKVSNEGFSSLSYQCHF